MYINKLILTIFTFKEDSAKVDLEYFNSYDDINIHKLMLQVFLF